MYNTSLARFVHGHRLIQVLYTFCVNFIFIFGVQKSKCCNGQIHVYTSITDLQPRHHDLVSSVMIFYILTYLLCYC